MVLIRYLFAADCVGYGLIMFGRTLQTGVRVFRVASDILDYASLLGLIRGVRLGPGDRFPAPARK